MTETLELHIHIYETPRGLRTWVIDSATQLTHVRSILGIQTMVVENDAFITYLYFQRGIDPREIHEARRRATTKAAAQKVTDS